MATNIAAIAFLGRRGDQRRAVAWSSLAYIAGRMAAYTVLAAVLSAGLLSAPAVASFLRTKLEGLIGPGLILLGMVVCGWLPVRIPGIGGLNELGTRLAARGFAGEFLMGAVFALAFCPVSAALFFGGLLPVVVKTGATVVLPVAYGVGTAVPVVVAVVILAGGLGVAGKRVQALRELGGKLQLVTGLVLVAAGVWMTVRGVFPESW